MANASVRVRFPAKKLNALAQEDEVVATVLRHGSVDDGEIVKGSKIQSKRNS
jgi:hypothetical protein